MQNSFINHHRPIKAIILAAGLSTRMGQTKQLLPFKGRPMLQYVIEQVLKLDCSEVVTVIGHEAKSIKDTINIRHCAFTWLENKDYDNGQSSSLYKGLSQVAFHKEDALVFLGDTPFIEKATCEKIISRGQQLAKEKTQPFVIRPKYKQTKGHPVYFANLDAAMIQSIQMQTGQSFVNTINHEAIEVDDRGILLDIDTMQAYKSLVEQDNNN